MTFSSGTYLPFPVAHLTSTEVVLRGVGIRNTISVALSFAPNTVLTDTVYSTRDLPCSMMIGCILRGRFTFVVQRYLNNNRPSYFLLKREKGKARTS